MAKNRDSKWMSPWAALQLIYARLCMPLTLKKVCGKRSHAEVPRQNIKKKKKKVTSWTKKKNSSTKKLLQPPPSFVISNGLPEGKPLLCKPTPNSAHKHLQLGTHKTETISTSKVYFRTPPAEICAWILETTLLLRDKQTKCDWLRMWHLISKPVVGRNEGKDKQVKIALWLTNFGD